VVKESEGLKGIVLHDENIHEGVFSEAVENVGFAIREAEDGGKFLEASLITTGFSKNTVNTRRKTYQRYYDGPTLEEAAPGTDGMEVSIGYDEHNDPLDYPKEFGVWKNPRFEEGAIRGDIHVYPDQYWVLDRIKVNPKTLGLSIEGKGKYRFGVVEGKPAATVVGLNIERARLVKTPAAGGAITGIRESEINKGGEQRMKLEELTESERKELMTEAREVVTAELDVKAKDEKIAKLEEAAKKDEAKYAELETKLNEAKSVELIESAFPDELPDVAKTKLREALKGETDKEKIAEAVMAEADYIATLTEAGKVKGMGGGAPDKREAFVGSATKDVLNMAGYKEPEEKKDDKK